MTTLTAEQILAPIPPRVEAVEVPAWGGTVHLRRLPAYDGALFADALASIGAGRAAELRKLATLVAFALCDESGAPLFDPPADAVDGIARKEPAALMMLAHKAMELNARTPTEPAAGGLPSEA